MNEQLKDLLLAHYGELMHEHSNNFDYFKRIGLVGKMNAINLLLGLPKVKYLIDSLDEGNKFGGIQNKKLNS